MNDGMRKLLSLFFLLPLISRSQKKVETDHLNVVIIFTDDQGYQDVSCYGSRDIEIPNQDAMVKVGIRLTDFYAAQAICSASRAGLLTGCYPNRVGIYSALITLLADGMRKKLGDSLREIKGVENRVVGKIE